MKYIGLIDSSATSAAAACHAALLSSDFVYADATWNTRVRREPVRRIGLEGIGKYLDWSSDAARERYDQLVGGRLYADEIYSEFGELFASYRESDEWDAVIGESIVEEDLLGWANTLTRAALVVGARPVSSNRLVVDCLETTLWWAKYNLDSAAVRDAANKIEATPLLPFLVVWPRFGFEHAEQVAEVRLRYADQIGSFCELLDREAAAASGFEETPLRELLAMSASVAQRLQCEADEVFRAMSSMRAAKHELTSRLIDKSFMTATAAGLAAYTQFDLPVVFLVTGAAFLAMLSETGLREYLFAQKKVRGARPGLALLVDMSVQGHRLWPAVAHDINARNAG